MDKENKQHVRVPEMELKSERGLKFIDPFVYACIKKHMNKDTKEAFPSISTIMEQTELSRQSVLDSISRLEAQGFIKVRRGFGKVNTYLFTDLEPWEMFSNQFLDSPKMSVKEKAYWINAQSEMFKDPNTNTGSVMYDSEKFASKIGLSVRQAKDIEKSLIAKGILTLEEMDQKELIEVNGVKIPKHGFNLYKRIYNFEAVDNAIAIKFMQHDQQLTDQAQNIQELQNITIAQNRKIAELEEQVKQLQKLTTKLTYEEPVIL